MSTDHYTILCRRVEQLEREQKQVATIVAISSHVACDLQGMNIPAWMSAGFGDEKADELVSGFNEGPHYAEKMNTPLGKVKVLTFTENKWGDDAVRIWEGQPLSEPKYGEMAKVCVKSPDASAFVGYVIASKWDAPEGRWLYKVSLSEDDRDPNTFDNWVIADWITPEC
jgi:hypothetical protein